MKGGREEELIVTALLINFYTEPHNLKYWRFKMNDCGLCQFHDDDNYYIY